MLIALLFLSILQFHFVSVFPLISSTKIKPDRFPYFRRQRRPWCSREDFWKNRHVVQQPQRLQLASRSSLQDDQKAVHSMDRSMNNCSALEWVSIGISSVYLAHFCSLYTQLPGLVGQTGLLPIIQRVSELQDQLWVLDTIPSAPEVGVELFAACGILVSAAQLIFGRKLRQGPLGVVTFGLLWVCWHDLVISGGRFMQYQMDRLLLDAAPLTLLAASGLANDAAIFGYRWLLSRLYIGAGAVKLLSCDASWRDLSAVHWHFQSQPIPNPIAALAFWHVPDAESAALTWTVLVVEMAAPFLFLAPSRTIRRVAFSLNVFLMVGIALFGNFGPLQFVLVVIGFALLDDLPAIDSEREEMSIAVADPNEALTLDLVSAGSLALAAGGAFWAVNDIGVACRDTLPIVPLVYGLVALGFVVALLSPIMSSTIFITASSSNEKIKMAFNVAVSLSILVGSASVMANGLGVYGFPSVDWLNFGAIPYGLFATITGVNGRPVAAFLESASSNGPWSYVPMLYQVNDPETSLPFIFPHFPRLDWTVWFLPLGGREVNSLWMARLLHGISVKDAAVLHLLQGGNADSTISNSAETHSIVRVVSPETYEMSDPVSSHGIESGVRTWMTKNNENMDSAVVLQSSNEEDGLKLVADPAPWPSTPILRTLSDDTNRPEYFIWECLVGTAIARQAIRTNIKDNP